MKKIKYSSMKSFLLLLMIIFPAIASGQTVVYKMAYEPLQTESQLRAFIDTVLNTLPNGYTIQPTVIHNYSIADTLVKCIILKGVKGDKPGNADALEFMFDQDSVYLNLHRKLPEFIIKDINGNDFNQDDLIGRPTVILVWSDGIPQSYQQFEAFNKVVEIYGPRVQFLDITESLCDASTIPNFLKENPLKFRHLVNGTEMIDKVLMIRARPRILILDRFGIVREIQTVMPQSKDVSTGRYSFDEKAFCRLIDSVL